MFQAKYVLYPPPLEKVFIVKVLPPPAGDMEKLKIRSSLLPEFQILL